MSKTHLQYFSGTLLDKYGNVLADRDVWLRIKGTGTQFPIRKTSTDGQFIEENLPPGVYEILVRDPSTAELQVVGAESHCPPDLLYKQVAWVRKLRTTSNNPYLLVGLLKKDGKDDVHIDSQGKSVFNFTVHFYALNDFGDVTKYQQWHGVEAWRENHEIVLRLNNPTVLENLNDGAIISDPVQLNKQFLVVQDIRDERYLPLEGGTMEGPIFIDHTIGKKSGSFPLGDFPFDLIHGRNDMVVSAQKSIEIRAGEIINRNGKIDTPNYIRLKTNAKQGIVIDQDGHVGIGDSGADPKNVLDVKGDAVIGSSYYGEKTAPANGLLVEGKVGINASSEHILSDDFLLVHGGVRITDKIGIASIEDVNEPKNSLDVKGNAVIGGNFYGTTVAPANGLLIEGDVGIGEDGLNPKNKLDVQGSAVIGTELYGKQQAPENGMLVEGKVGINTTTDKLLANDWLMVQGSARITDKLGIADSADLYEPLNQLDVKGQAVIGESLYGQKLAPENGLLIQGTVGIGTTGEVPINTVDIKGNAVIGSDFYAQTQAPENGLLIEGKVGINAKTDAILTDDWLLVHGSARVTESLGIADDTDLNQPVNTLDIKGNVVIGASLYGTTHASKNGLKVEGDVGIGTQKTLPANKLDVQGNMVIGSDFYGQEKAPQNGLLIEGKVGINATSDKILTGEQIRVHGVARVTEKIGIADALEMKEPLNSFDIKGNAVIGEDFYGTNTAPENGLLVQGEVGIGASGKAPANNLDIQGNAVIGESYYGTSQAPHNGLLVEGKVGINSKADDISPNTMLRVEGIIRTTDKIAIAPRSEVKEPVNQLDIKGKAVIGKSLYGISAAPENGLLVEGKVGINTNADAIGSTTMLYVHGDARITDKLGVADSDDLKSPLNTLDVKGNAAIGSAIYGVAAAPVDGLLVQGDVGIGSLGTKPVNKLDVQGNVVIGSQYYAEQSAPIDGLLVEGKVGINTTALSIQPGDWLRVQGNARITDKVGIADASDTHEPLNQLDIKGKAVIGDTFYGKKEAPENGLLVEGNVGIGTNGTEPLNTLDVQGNMVLGVDYYGNKTAPRNGLLVEGKVGINAINEDILQGDWLLVQGGARVTDKVGIADAADRKEPKNTLDVKGSAVIGAAFYGVADASDNGMLIQGDVGIGESGTKPVNKIDIEGSAVVGTDYYGKAKAPENGLLVEGKVGVNTEADSIGPYTLLHVDGIIRGTEKLGIADADDTHEPKNQLDIKGNAVIGSGFYGTTSAPENGMLIEGGVGIGSSGNLPRNTLDVQGNAVIGTHYYGESPAPENGLLVEGKVGINTTSDAILPGDWLRVKGTVRVTDKIAIADSKDIKEPINELDIKGRAVVGASFYGKAEAPVNGMLIQGDVGIGVSGDAPMNKLDIQGNASIGSNYYGVQKAPVNGLLIEGKVGINTETEALGPDTMLRVDGNARITDKIAIAEPSETKEPVNQLDIKGNAAIGSAFFGTMVAPENGLLVEGNVGIGSSGKEPVNALDIQGSAVVGVDYYGKQVAPENGVLIQGKVGINVKADSILSDTFLHVQGNVRVTDKLGVAGSSDIREPKNQLDIKGEAVIGSSFYGTVEAPDDGLLVQGNVGIAGPGTKPVNTLDIAGNAVIGAGIYGNKIAPANGLLIEGQVGINTDAEVITPATKLFVKGNTRVTEKLGIAETVEKKDPLNALDISGGAVIGKKLYGTSKAPENGLLIEGKVGIGISENQPRNNLDIHGNMVIGAGYFGVQKAPENGLLVQGPVGINTSSETISSQTSLQVQGTVRVNNKIAITDSSDTKEPKNQLDIKGKAVIGRQYFGNKTAPEDSLLVEGKIGIGTDVIDDRVKLQVNGVAKVATPEQDSDVATKKYVDHRYNIGIIAPGRLYKSGTGFLPGRVVIPSSCKIISLRAYINEKGNNQVKFNLNYRRYISDSSYDTSRSIRVDGNPFVIAAGKHYMADKNPLNFITNGFSEGDVLEISVVEHGGASDLSVTIECTQA